MNSFSQLIVPFIHPRYMRTLIGRYGVVRTTFLLSVVGFALSLVIMAPINWLTRGSLFTGLLVTTVLCCTILPFHLYQLGHLLADLEQAHQAMYLMATQDELTQTHNRRYFVEQLRLLCAASPGSLTLLLLDIDNFKAINDSFGHDAGDLVLRQVSQLCLATKRPSDLFARYGGEEFAFLLPQTDGQSAVCLAESIRSAIAQALFSYGPHHLRCTVSIGIATATGFQIRADTLLTAADQALYSAKRNGKNQVALHGRHMPTLPHPVLATLSAA